MTTNAGPAGGRRAIWCSIWASSQRVTTSRSMTIQDPIRFTHCRCGSARHADWPSCSPIPTVPEEPKGAEPAALVEQAADAVRRVAAAGLLPPGGRVAEYGSPHGGSWLGLLAARGLRPVDGTARSGCDPRLLRHDACGRPGGRASPSARRGWRQAGCCCCSIHSLDTIVRHGQWNALRHGHYAYYSTTALVAMLAAVGFSPRTSWSSASTAAPCCSPPAATRTIWAADGTRRHRPALLAAEARTGVTDPAVVSGLQREVTARAGALHDWLAASADSREDRARLRRCLAGGRAAAPAGVDSDLLPAVADASPAKPACGCRDGDSRHQSGRADRRRAGRGAGLRLRTMTEVREAYPEVEARAANGWTPTAARCSVRSLEQHPQPSQAAPSGGTDAADREPEFVRDLRVRSRRVGHQHLHEALPAQGSCVMASRTLPHAPRRAAPRRFPARAWRTVERVILVGKHQPLADARIRRHSFRAVAASQDPTRSACSIRSICSISRIQVVWNTSAASLSTSLKSLVIDQISRPYFSTRPSHAHGSPLRPSAPASSHRGPRHPNVDTGLSKAGPPRPALISPR